MGLAYIKQLLIPAELKEMYPLTSRMNETIQEKRAELISIFEGRNNKLILIIGPCSADNEDSVMEYVTRLVSVQEKVSDRIVIIPRIYTNKPRTTGEGYKGMLHQPDPTDKPNLFKGIEATRHLHMRVVMETGFACADEMLYSENYAYLDDLLAYVAVGARSVEDQQHRLTSSGISVPVGMKNPTSGDYQVMFNAISAAQNGHSFIYRGWQVHSDGNSHAHAILRGFTDQRGAMRPNYHYEDLIRFCDAYDEMNLLNPGLIVDANHCNSNKKPFEQRRIIKEVLYSARHDRRIAAVLKGFMVESYLVDGAQPPGGGCYGQSITDPCIGWEATEKLIYEIADLI